jgi:hypothetical protein
MYIQTYSRESRNSSFGGNVGCRSRLAYLADQAGDVDDVPLRLPQVRQSVLAGGEVAEIYSKLLFLLFSKRKI